VNEAKIPYELIGIDLDSDSKKFLNEDCSSLTEDDWKILLEWWKKQEQTDKLSQTEIYNWTLQTEEKNKKIHLNMTNFFQFCHFFILKIIKAM